MSIVIVTIRGFIRDRVLRALMVAVLMFLAVPAVSTLSMRQVTELAMTLCLSLASFILLLLAIFLGGVSLWRDVERRYTHSILTLPWSRAHYLFGRFAGIGLFILGTAVLMGLMTIAVLATVVVNYAPERSVSWAAVVAALGFNAFQALILVAFAVLFSSVSSSFFLPVFGTIAVYLTGGASQQVYDFVQSQSGQSLSPLVRQATEVLYYILPNFSAFDLKVNAIYSIPLDPGTLALTAGYGLLYTGFVMTLAMAIYSRRELG